MKSDILPPRRLPDAALGIRDRIEASKRPLLLSHVRLDGDALGTELALAHILKARGARPHVVNDSAIPQVFEFLPGASEVGTSPAALRDDYDLAIVLDVPTWARARAVRNKLRADLPTVSIDHHLQMELVADLAWTDTNMSSVGEMVYLLARAGRWTIPPEAATCLYVAIITDCGRFTFSNTTPSALRAAADLIELGADHRLVTERVYRQESPALMRLRAELVQGFKFHAGGRIGLVVLTREMMERNGVDPIDTQEIADIPRCLPGVVVGILLREMTEPGKVKVSLRSRNEFNIEPVARKFGGGGHREAAGCEIAGDLTAVEQAVITEVTARLKAAGVVGEEGGAS